MKSLRTSGNQETRLNLNNGRANSFKQLRGRLTDYRGVHSSLTSFIPNKKTIKTESKLVSDLVCLLKCVVIFLVFRQKKKKKKEAFF